MKYIGMVIKWITFPGTFLHAFWEHVICKLYGVPVEDTHYMQGSEMVGHIEHGSFPTPIQKFEFAFFPALFNFVLGIFTALPAVFKIFIQGETQAGLRILYFVMIWFGVSLLTNINPLIEDAMFMWENLYKSEGKPNLFLRIILFPFAGLLYIGSYLNTYGLSLITSLLTVFGLPFIAMLFV